MLSAVHDQTKVIGSIAPDYTILLATSGKVKFKAVLRLDPNLDNPDTENGYAVIFRVLFPCKPGRSFNDYASAFRFYADAVEKAA